ncbi:hypothetical protein OH76DRAFT_592667 [Lentinus brumalis]|uniref:Ino eighty subunit 1 n=1 Tax=Lentinus brumalis TaxID=2498619 RepID=A0A371DU51_9APHY|nr:hypothetical protein OH76DRAFT_592667 [Polyporus brumalis]
MPPSASSSQHKKNLAVKRQDGEPLTRVDLQYDLLYSIFTDRNAVFTDPYTTIRGDPAGTKVTFRDLYVNALIHSPRCSKASRDKIREAPDFGNEFAMISLLSNVGRINTTMAFFPEMKTALRTYHPVPALQRTNGNLQDAPRIKNILKTCFLPDEAQGMVTTPNDVLARSRSGKVPPTSIVNLIFVLASHSTIARAHFAPRAPVDFLDLFTPVNISSQSRARAFLWLCYHFHEVSTPNPFSDASSESNTNRAPPFVHLSREGTAAENVDTAEEHQRGLDMTDLRRRFLETKAREELAKESEGELRRPQASASKGRGRGKGKDLADIGSGFRTREVSPAESNYSMPYVHKEEDMLEGPGRPPVRRLPSPRPQHWVDRRQPTPPYGRHSLHGYPPEATTFPRTTIDPYPRPTLSSNVDSLQHSNGKPLRTQSRKPRGHASQTPLFVHEPYQHPSGRPPYPRPVYAAPTYAPSSPETPKRTMLEQAWHVSMTTDPLIDSDDEMYADENTRLDYVLRLRIISRLRGKEPTPPRELGPAYNLNPVNPMIALGAR